MFLTTLKDQQNTASRKLNGEQKNDRKKEKEKSLNLQLQSTNAYVLQKSYTSI